MRWRHVVPVVAAAVSLAACGNTADPDAVRQIRECIERGGVPSYTQTAHGEVRHFLGCTVGGAS